MTLTETGRNPQIEPDNQAAKPLFHILDTPVTAELSILFSVFNMLGLGIWLAGPQYSWPDRLRRGGLMLLTYILADLIHYVGHILSSRWAGGPIDRIHMAAPLPRAVYLDNDVPPRVHRLRSVGGPLASGLAALFFGALRLVIPKNSVGADWLKQSAGLNGLTAIGSLAPLPLVDGGAILKWTLVEQGQPPEAAEQKVQQVNLAFGTVAAVVGIALLLGRRRLPAMAALMSALASFATYMGLLR